MDYSPTTRKRSKLDKGKLRGIVPVTVPSKKKKKKKKSFSALC